LQVHPNQIGQRIAARLGVVHWSSRSGFGCGANNFTPKGKGSLRTGEPQRRRKENGK